MLKPGRAFSLATPRTPRRHTKSARREASRLSSNIPYVARRKDVCGVRPAHVVEIVRACFDKASGCPIREVDRVAACLQGMRGARTSQPRDTHVWAACAGAGRSTWYAPRMAGLGCWVGSYFEGGRMCRCRYMSWWLGLTPWVCYYCSSSPWFVVVCYSSSHRIFLYTYISRVGSHHPSSSTQLYSYRSTTQHCLSRSSIS